MDNYKYSNTAMPIQDVMANIEEYIIPENRAIIEYLWDKNILTTLTNDYENDFSGVKVGKLSEENEEIFRKMVLETQKLDRTIFPTFTSDRVITVPIVPGKEDTFEAFKPLVDLLKDQDVQKDGYMTVDEFYISCGCYDIINNPNRNIEEPKYEDFPNIHEYKVAVEKYLEITRLPRIKVVDESKITKPLEEYLAEKDLLDCYDNEEGKIFYNRRLYEGHMRFKASIQK